MPDHVDLDPVTTAWYQAILAWDAQIAELQAKRARAVEHIQAAMGDAAEARIGGQPVVTWKPSRPGLRLDRKLLEDKLGADVVAGFLVESRPARPFKILGGPDA